MGVAPLSFIVLHVLGVFLCVSLNMRLGGPQGGGVAGTGWAWTAGSPHPHVCPCWHVLHTQLTLNAHSTHTQVIEFYPDGNAIELMRPRTARELGLHPRDLGLFAPLSRLAAPQVCVRG